MHLLCGLDESAPGRNAAAGAGTLARLVGASLTLLHVVAGGPPVAESTRATVGAIADDVAARTGARVALRIETGDPTASLLSVAAELDADLLVIGHTRRGRLAGILLGEVHDRIVRAAPMPVMLVPAGASLEAPGRVVLACRRSAHPPRAAELAGRLAGRMQAPVTVTQVVPTGPRAERPTSWQVYDAARRDGGAARAAAGDLAVEYAEYEGDPGRTLAAVPEDLDAALLVIGRRRQPAWRSLLCSSVASEVARNAQRPVIVV